MGRHGQDGNPHLEPGAKSYRRNASMVAWYYYRNELGIIIYTLYHLVYPYACDL